MNLWKTAAVLLAAAALTGCSLLKVAVSTGDPLSKEDASLRVTTRGLYYDMAAQVARTADSIVAVSTDTDVRLAAIRWKIRATRAGVEASMQAIPEVAMADLWILTRRMERAFAAAPDSLLFGVQSALARDVAAGLERRSATVAREALSSARYDLMARFVDEYVRKNPTDDSGIANTTLAWIEYLRKNGIEHAYATGSIAEVLADVSDRVSGQTQQLSNSIGWSKDLIEIRFQQDSLRAQVGGKLDSLERHFDRMVAVAEHLPEISDKMLRELSRQASQLIYTMNASVDNAFGNFDLQREALQQYVTHEREALVVQLRQVSGELVQNALQAAPGVIGKALFYIVVCLLLLLGVPFALGFWLGGVRQRSRERRQESGK